MAVSSGLKRSQRVSKCHETLGAEHARASHAVSQRHETLGAERIRVLPAVSECPETLGAERIRAGCAKVLCLRGKTNATWKKIKVKIVERFFLHKCRERRA